MRSAASTFNFQDRLFSLRLHSSWLFLIFRLPSLLFFPLPFFHSRVSEGDMWPVQLAFTLFVVGRMPLSYLTLWSVYSLRTRAVQMFFSITTSHYVRSIPCVLSEVSKFVSKFMTSFNLVQTPATSKLWSESVSATDSVCTSFVQFLHRCFTSI